MSAMHDQRERIEQLLQWQQQARQRHRTVNLLYALGVVIAFDLVLLAALAGWVRW